LAFGRANYSYAFLDEYAKREIRRRILKAVAIPGYQVPYASREMPIARGWGTGGLQVTLSIIGPQDIVKVIDQGDDESVNAANLKRFIAEMADVATTTDALAATIIQSRHRVPEERLREGQALVLQVPIPEPLRHIERSMARTEEMHADADYALMWLELYEQLVRYGDFVAAASYPVIVHQRYLMSPSPIPRWDTPTLHHAAHLTLLSAGREKRLYAVPPYTDVRPVEFSDHFFSVEKQTAQICCLTGATHKYMNEIPDANGGSRFTLSDTAYAGKLLEAKQGHPVQIGETYYDDTGHFYIPGYFRTPIDQP
jgi:alpha-D-ribose 1-methylphosphonate 5-phosphate C-P lyase